MFARWSKTIVATCLVAFTAVGAGGSPSDADYTLRTTVEEVRLSLVATDRQHRYVNDLTPTELAIVDNEVVVRKFRSFSHSPEIRFNVLLLIDASDSVSDRRKRQTAGVIDSIRNADWGASDSVTVMTFGPGTPQLSCVKNCASMPNQSSRDSSSKAALTPLYDSIITAAGLLSQNNSRDSKSILVIFSDGLDNYSIRGLSDAVSSLQRIDASAYSVDLNGRGSTSDGTSALRQIAGSTGGLTLTIDQGPAPILESVLSDLRSAYVLTYVPPNPSQGRHFVQVLPTRNLDLVFRSRQGYIYNHVRQEARASR